MQLVPPLALALWALGARAALGGRARPPRAPAAPAASAAPAAGSAAAGAPPGAPASLLQRQRRLRAAGAEAAHGGNGQGAGAGATGGRRPTRSPVVAAGATGADPSGRCGNGTLSLAAAGAVEFVVSTWADDLAWLGELDVPTTVYVHNRSATRQTHCFSKSGACFKQPTEKLQAAAEGQRQLAESSALRENEIRFVDIPNFGDEALAYLTHIVDHYDRLPEAVVFLHGHESAWHAPRSMKRILNSTCFSQAVGYHNLNHGGGARPLNFCVGHHKPAKNIQLAARDEVESLLKQNWRSVFKAAFNNTFPRRVCLDCCAQFVVSRARLQNHPREFYEKLLQLVRDGKTTMEREWRMVFVPEEVLTSASNNYEPL